MADLTDDERIKLITDNLDEVLNPEIIEDVIRVKKRPLTIYWGTATTGRPHCAYFVPIMQIASFLRAGCKVKILLADIHGFMDNLKAPIELVNHRAQYYRYVVTGLLEAIGVPLAQLEFVLGSDYQLKADYQMDLMRLETICTIHDARRAGAEVVKQVENATLSGLVYPLMQALDEQYLGVDAQFGGVDQRKIFTLAKDILPRVGYAQRAHLMNKMVPGLTGGKMSASDPESKIDVLDPPDAVAKKLKKAKAVPRETADNGILAFVEFVLLPASALRPGATKPEFTVPRRAPAEPLVYNAIGPMHADYAADTLTPQDLKPAVIAALNGLLAPVQAAFAASPAWQECARAAYPPAEPDKKPKKEKKPKDRGTRFPGAARVEAQPDGSVEGAGAAQASVAGSAAEALADLKVAGGDAA